nr:hypothetical protein [Tanacetum cinerariifolium]
MSTSETYTLADSGSNSGKQRTVICYNCKGERHMSKQSRTSRRSSHTYDSDYDELNTAKVALMANLSHYASNALAKYVLESQQDAIQNSKTSAQQDALILSVIEQLKTQVINCTKINLDNKTVYDTLTAELERYKEQVKVLKEGQNVEVKSQDNFLDLHEQNAEIDGLKQTLSEQLQENESLMKTVTVLKNDFKKEEVRNIDREIALEKKIKHLDNIVYKRDQSVQTIHMLTKPKFFYDHSTKQALETLMLAEERHLKMTLKQQDLMILEKKNSVNSLDPNPSKRPTKVDVPKELPKVSMVNTRLKKLKHHLAGFDVVVIERTTPTTINEGSWGFEHTKACFRDEIIPFVKALKDLFNTFDQYLINELTDVQNVFHQMEQAMKQHRLESKTFKIKLNQVLNENEQLLEQVINKDIVNIVVTASMNNAYVRTRFDHSSLVTNTIKKGTKSKQNQTKPSTKRKAWKSQQSKVKPDKIEAKETKKSRKTKAEGLKLPIYKVYKEGG